MRHPADMCNKRSNQHHDGSLHTCSTKGPVGTIYLQTCEAARARNSMCTCYAGSVTCQVYRQVDTVPGKRQFCCIWRPFSPVVYICISWFLAHYSCILLPMLETGVSLITCLATSVCRRWRCISSWHMTIDGHARLLQVDV